MFIKMLYLSCDLPSGVLHILLTEKQKTKKVSIKSMVTDFAVDCLTLCVVHTSEYVGVPACMCGSERSALLVFLS